MEKTKQIKHRNTMPLYAVCAVWLVGTFALHMRGVGGCVSMAVFSVIAFFITKRINPDWTETVTEKEPEKELSPMEKERNQALSDIRSLNDRIQDPVISEKISRIERATGHIYSAVMDKPEKKNEVRTFFQYYLPTTIKLLNEYERISSLGVSGENIDTTKLRIEDMLETVCTAFEKQVDLLYGDEALDISTDIAVFKQLMQQQGLQ